MQPVFYSVTDPSAMMIAAFCVVVIAFICLAVVAGGHDLAANSRHPVAVMLALVTGAVVVIGCSIWGAFAVAPHYTVERVSADGAVEHLEKAYDLTSVELDGDEPSVQHARGTRVTHDAPEFYGYHDDVEVRFRAVFEADGTPHIAIISPANAVTAKELERK